MVYLEDSATVGKALARPIRDAAHSRLIKKPERGKYAILINKSMRPVVGIHKIKI